MSDFTLVINVQVDRLPDVSNSNKAQFGVRICTGIKKTGTQDLGLTTIKKHVQPWSNEGIFKAWDVGNKRCWSFYLSPNNEMIKQDEVTTTLPAGAELSKISKCLEELIRPENVIMPSNGEIQIDESEKAAPSFIGLMESLSSLPHPIPRGINIWAPFQVDLPLLGEDGIIFAVPRFAENVEWTNVEVTEGTECGYASSNEVPPPICPIKTATPCQNAYTDKCQLSQLGQRKPLVLHGKYSNDKETFAIEVRVEPSLSAKTSKAHNHCNVNNLTLTTPTCIEAYDWVGSLFGRLSELLDPITACVTAFEATAEELVKDQLQTVAQNALHQKFRALIEQTAVTGDSKCLKTAWLVRLRAMLSGYADMSVLAAGNVSYSPDDSNSSVSLKTVNSILGCPGEEGTEESAAHQIQKSQVLWLFKSLTFTIDSTVTKRLADLVNADFYEQQSHVIRQWIAEDFSRDFIENTLMKGFERDKGLFGKWSMTIDSSSTSPTNGTVHLTRCLTLGSVALPSVVAAIFIDENNKCIQKHLEKLIGPKIQLKSSGTNLQGTMDALVTEDAAPLAFMVDQIGTTSESDMWERVAGVGVLLGRQKNGEKIKWWSLNAAAIHVRESADSHLDSTNAVTLLSGSWPESSRVDPVPLVVAEVNGVKDTLIRYESRSLVAEMGPMLELGDRDGAPTLRPESYSFPAKESASFRLPPLTFGRTYFAYPYLIGHGGTVPVCLRKNEEDPTSFLAAIPIESGAIPITHDLESKSVKVTYLRTVPVCAPRLDKSCVWPGVFPGIEPLANELEFEPPPITLPSQQCVRFFYDAKQQVGLLQSPQTAGNRLAVVVKTTPEAVAKLQCLVCAGAKELVPCATELKFEFTVAELDKAYIEVQNTGEIDIDLSPPKAQWQCSVNAPLSPWILKPGATESDAEHATIKLQRHGSMRFFYNAEKQEGLLKSPKAADNRLVAVIKTTPKAIALLQCSVCAPGDRRLDQNRSEPCPIKLIFEDDNLDQANIVIKNTRESTESAIDLTPPKIQWLSSKDEPQSPWVWAPEATVTSRNVTILDGISDGPSVGPTKLKIKVCKPTVSLNTFDRWVNDAISSKEQEIRQKTAEDLKIKATMARKGEPIDDPAVNSLFLEVKRIWPEHRIWSSVFKEGSELSIGMKKGEEGCKEGKNEFFVCAGSVYEFRYYGVVATTQPYSELVASARFSKAVTASWRKVAVKASSGKVEEFWLGAPLVLTVEVASDAMPSLEKDHILLKRSKDNHKATIRLDEENGKDQVWTNVNRWAALHQRWSWRGRPQPAFPVILDASESGFGWSESESESESKQPLSDATRTFIEKAFLGRRADDIGTIHEERFQPSNIAQNEIIHNLDYECGVHLWRFAVRLKNRYLPLRPHSRKMIVYSHVKNETDDPQWKQAIVPDDLSESNDQIKLRRPGLMLVLPLTETFMADGAVPPLLAIFNEPMFANFNVADSIEPCIEVVEYTPDKEPDKTPGGELKKQHWPEFGPDPIRDVSAGKPEPEPVPLRTDGPIGYSFDAGTETGLFNHAGLLISPVAQNVKPWSFIKLRFRRVSEPAFQLNDKLENASSFTLKDDLGLAFTGKIIPKDSSVLSVKVNAVEVKCSYADGNLVYDLNGVKITFPWDPKSVVYARIIVSKRPKTNVGDVTLKLRFEKEEGHAAVMSSLHNTWLTVASHPIPLGEGGTITIENQSKSGKDSSESGPVCQKVRVSDFTPGVWCQFADSMSHVYVKVAEGESKPLHVSCLYAEYGSDSGKFVIKYKGENSEPKEIEIIGTATKEQAEVQEIMCQVITEYVSDAFGRLRERPISIRSCDSNTCLWGAEKFEPNANSGRIRFMRVLLRAVDKVTDGNLLTALFPGISDPNNFADNPKDAMGMILGISKPIEWALQS